LRHRAAGESFRGSGFYRRDAEFERAWLVGGKARSESAEGAEVNCAIGEVLRHGRSSLDFSATVSLGPKRRLKGGCRQDCLPHKGLRLCGE
jgi:hypothetical protein